MTFTLSAFYPGFWSNLANAGETKTQMGRNEISPQSQKR